MSYFNKSNSVRKGKKTWPILCLLFFSKACIHRESKSLCYSIINSKTFSYSVGVISREKVAAFERVLWRACRRTAFLRSADIDDPLDNPNGVSVLAILFDLKIIKL